MKQAKQRVIAIDYFRGICILIVIINHAVAFSWPLPLISGDGRLWTSAAEMFFLLSGLTLWIVRGHKILTNFRETASKIWRRAASIYFIYIAVALASLYIALILNSHGLPIRMPGRLPSMSPLSLFGKIFDLSYTIGWANFLMFYTLYLILAPFAMRALNSRWWPVVPVISVAWYATNSFGLLLPGGYASFSIWQLYFFLGLCLGRARPAILAWYYGLKPQLNRHLGTAVIITAAVSLGAKLLWAPFTQEWLHPSANSWLPEPIRHAYIYLIGHQPSMDFLLQNERAGLLRPAVTLLTLAAAYLIYQRNKQFLLKYSGKLVNAFGRDTLWIFTAQAVAIPLIATMPVFAERRFYNPIMTLALLGLMWLITQRRFIAKSARNYGYELLNAFYEAKYAVLYRQDDA